MYEKIYNYICISITLTSKVITDEKWDLAKRIGQNSNFPLFLVYMYLYDMNV